MDVQDRINELKALGAGKTPRELSEMLKKDPKLTAEVRDLYLKVFKKALSGCGNCIADGFFELVTTKEIKIMAELSKQFAIRPGAVLHDKSFNADKMLSVGTCTDELALHHLADDSDKIKYFAVYPKDWEQLVEEYKAKLTEPIEKKIKKSKKEEQPE